MANPNISDNPNVTGIDALTRAGAHEIAERIQRYWALQLFRPPNVWIEQDHSRESIFVVRSDMVGGLPPGESV